MNVADHLDAATLPVFILAAPEIDLNMPLSPGQVIRCEPSATVIVPGTPLPAWEQARRLIEEGG